MKSATGPNNVLGIHVVEVADAASLPPIPTGVDTTTIPIGGAHSINLIGIGDGVQIVIYEAGVNLFASAVAASAGDTGLSAAGGARAETLPMSVVDENGNIMVPFVGRIHVAGMRTYELQRLITRGLKGISQNPQVLVTIANPVSQAVLVGGEVAKPGRVVPSTGRETVSDIVTLAGGYKGDASDLVVTLTRGSQRIEGRVSSLFRSPLGSLLVIGGDRLQVRRDPLTFSAFGAPGKVDLFSFGQDNLTLMEAVARVGGSSSIAGDPKAIFLFRYVSTPQGPAPIIYHLNLQKTNGFFLAQRFTMEKGDVLYIGNAAANQPSKLVQIIAQFASPLLIGASVIRQ